MCLPVVKSVLMACQHCVDFLNVSDSQPVNGLSLQRRSDLTDPELSDG